MQKAGWFRGVGRYYRDPKASTLGKLIAIVALIYVVVPVDLIPDVPIVGWLDDIGVLGLATAWLSRRIRSYREPEALLSRGSGDDGEQSTPVVPSA